MKDRTARVLVVDDEQSLREILSRALASIGVQVVTAAKGEEALQILSGSSVDAMLTDIRMPGMDGLELIRRAKARSPDMPVMMMTGFATVDTAVEAMRHGARDYITKPFNVEEVIIRVKRVLAERALSEENRKLREELHHGHDVGRGSPIIGKSSQMKKLFETVEAVSQNRSNVLIQGETGTGKELVAKAIHFSGPRADEQFIPLNCGSVSKSLLESQLFGHVKGAFTGAVKDNPGYFVAAHGGTLFLDEVTEVDTEIQVRLLRAIQEREVTPVGGSKPVPVDVRILAATNRDARKAVDEGLLRQDLYFRLAVVVMEIPPLRVRRDDVPLLVKYFNDQMSTEYGLGAREIPTETMDRLVAYDWPGNVRELENVIERAFALGGGPQMLPKDLPQQVREQRASDEPSRSDGKGPQDLEGAIYALERRLLDDALARCEGNKARAAQALGIERKKLYRLLHKHGLMDGE
jgi:DNA-binding NtrC family response regulator